MSYPISVKCESIEGRFSPFAFLLLLQYTLNCVGQSSFEHSPLRKSPTRLQGTYATCKAEYFEWGSWITSQCNEQASKGPFAGDWTLMGWLDFMHAILQENNGWEHTNISTIFINFAHFIHGSMSIMSIGNHAFMRCPQRLHLEKGTCLHLRGV